MNWAGISSPAMSMAWAGGQHHPGGRSLRFEIAAPADLAPYIAAKGRSRSMACR
jgi:hypothetical protein